MADSDLMYCEADCDSDDDNLTENDDNGISEDDVLLMGSNVSDNDSSSESSVVIAKRDKKGKGLGRKRVSSCDTPYTKKKCFRKLHGSAVYPTAYQDSWEKSMTSLENRVYFQKPTFTVKFAIRMCP